MKLKHLMIRIEQCMVLSRASNCVRAQVGALLIDPARNVVLMDGYNGGPRGGGRLCGGESCDRDKAGFHGGERVEIGCHHAELNLVCNAASNGTSTTGAMLIVTEQPCMLCAKLIHHAGIASVVVLMDTEVVEELYKRMGSSWMQQLPQVGHYCLERLDGEGYPGLQYLVRNGVRIEIVDLMTMSEAAREKARKKRLTR